MEQIPIYTGQALSPCQTITIMPLTISLYPFWNCTSFGKKTAILLELRPKSLLDGSLYLRMVNAPLVKCNIQAFEEACWHRCFTKQTTMEPQLIFVIFREFRAQTYFWPICNCTCLSNLALAHFEAWKIYTKVSNNMALRKNSILCNRMNYMSYMSKMTLWVSLKFIISVTWIGWKYFLRSLKYLHTQWKS